MYILYIYIFDVCILIEFIIVSCGIRIFLYGDIAFKYLGFRSASLSKKINIRQSQRTLHITFNNCVYLVNDFYR